MPSSPVSETRTSSFLLSTLKRIEITQVILPGTLVIRSVAMLRCRRGKSETDEIGSVTDIQEVEDSFTAETARGETYL